MSQASASRPSTSRNLNGIRFERPRVQKPTDLLTSSTSKLLLEMLCHSLPMGALVLDAQKQVVFANAEALHVLSLWTEAGDSTSAKKNGSRPRLPSEIASACDHLRQEFMRRTHSPSANRPNFAARMRVRHRDRPRLSAVISLERSRRNRAVAGFCIFLQDGLTCNINGGRRDQLALLTLAERQVAKMVANGLKNDEVAEALGKSVGTVKTQLSSIFAKLEIGTRTQLVSLLRSLDNL